MRTRLLGLLVGGLCIGNAAGLKASDVQVPLPVPNRVELYVDGARLVHTVQVTAGRSRVSLPADVGALVQVEAADAWVVESRIDSSEPPPLPPVLIELATVRADLDNAAVVLAGQVEAAERVSAELGLRLGQRGVLPGDESTGWQAALDGMLTLRSGITASQLAQTAAWRDLRERAAAEAVPGITYAAALGLDDGRPVNDLGDPAANAQRAWSIAVERSALHRSLVIERAVAGPVTVITERTDLCWKPRARVIVAKAVVTLVRQAAVQVPAGLVLPTMPARLVSGTRAQPLAGTELVPRVITAGNAPVAERRSVTTTARPAGWAGSSAAGTAREQTWEIPALTIAARGPHEVEVMAELQKGPLTLTADEWVLAPDLSPVLVRRLSLRLDAQPLAAGTLELVVDGTVLGRRALPATTPGALLHLAAGEDQRVFIAATTHWNDDPNRPVNCKVDGNDYRLRNLSGTALTFACYLTRPLSAAKGVTVTADPATTAGWQQPQPGILRWELTLKPGNELTLRNGWVVEAEGKIKL